MMNEIQKEPDVHSAFRIPHSTFYNLVGADGVEPPTFAL